MYGNKTDDDEIECEIIAHYGIFSQGSRGWNKEVNLVSWNGRPAKLDIRNWQTDHEKCGKGITVTVEEAEELIKLLHKILSEQAPHGQKKQERTSAGKASRKKTANKKPEQAGTEKMGRKKKPLVSAALKPFYDELELAFGSGPDNCKSARNTLLKKYHPDRNSANIEFATRKTIKIKEAYDRIAAWWNENTR